MEEPQKPDALYARRALLARQLFALMSKVVKSSEPRAIALATELELSLSQMRALLVLWRVAKPMALGALAHGVGLSDAAAVRMVDGLLRCNLVVRREDENDRRIKRIALSATGRETVQRLVASKHEGLERLVDSLLPEELDRLSAALEPILERLELPLDTTPAQ